MIPFLIEAVELMTAALVLAWAIVYTKNLDTRPRSILLEAT
jgi:hypothetical protein